MVVRPARGADLTSTAALLDAAGLSTAGLPPSLANFLVAVNGGRIVGVVGLEPYGAAALLRSAAVAPDARGSGLGHALVRALLVHATARGIRDLYLLTTTAEEFFPRFGFERIAREEVPEPVRESVQFREGCPASATVMRARLGRA
jgi:N-acetylglutamate synthase-like GNAT family acetyltransferase